MFFFSCQLCLAALLICVTTSFRVLPLCRQSPLSYKKCGSKLCATPSPSPSPPPPPSPSRTPSVDPTDLSVLTSADLKAFSQGPRLLSRRRYAKRAPYYPQARNLQSSILDLAPPRRAERDVNRYWLTLPYRLSVLAIGYVGFPTILEVLKPYVDSSEAGTIVIGSIIPSISILVSEGAGDLGGERCETPGCDPRVFVWRPSLPSSFRLPSLSVFDFRRLSNSGLLLLFLCFSSLLLLFSSALSLLLLRSAVRSPP